MLAAELGGDALGGLLLQVVSRAAQGLAGCHAEGVGVDLFWLSVNTGVCVCVSVSVCVCVRSEEHTSELQSR